MSGRLRLAALLSGTGSNLSVLLDAVAAGRLPLDVVQVISNRADARGLELARAHGAPTAVIDRSSAGPAGQDAAIGALLAERKPDLVLLTGYMRILGAELVNEWRGRMVNQHPSLLPKYKGLNTYQRALQAGDTVHGASVHFVTPELDGGPVIAQARIPVRPGDDASALKTRLAPREHALLLAVMQLFAQGRLALGDGGVLLDNDRLQRPLMLDNHELHR